MNVAFYSVHAFEKIFYEELLKGKVKKSFAHYFFNYIPTRLTPATAILSQGHKVVCAFAHDDLGKETLKILKEQGVEFLALRSAGFNHVDLPMAKTLGLKVARVPAYSPYAVAEYALALILCLNRKIHRSYSRTRDLNFSLDGLVGFDLHGKTAGVVGTGKIGRALVAILKGLGMRILAFDKEPHEQLLKENIVQYTTLEDLLSQSDIVSLHVPLTKETRFMINKKSLELMKKTAMLINTGRGALLNTKDLIEALKKKTIASVGLDVYEEEENIFFNDFSEKGIDNDQLARLLTFPNVLLTSHQAFLTQEALKNIAETTLQNIDDFFHQKQNGNFIEIP